MRSDQDFCVCGELKSKRSKKCRSCYTPHNLSPSIPSVTTLIEERNSGLSIKDQAKKYSASPNTLRRIFQDVGVDTRHTKVDRFGRPKQEGKYITILVDKLDPMASMRNSNGRVLEHRLVVARFLGRPLLSTETVHHINGDTLDNRRENLQLRQGNHGSGRVVVCGDCGSDNIINISIIDEDQKFALGTTTSGIHLDFQDVLIKPRSSDVNSRKEVILERTFKFKWSDSPVSCVPILSSNMSSITTPTTIEVLSRYQMLSCIPKTKWKLFPKSKYAVQSIGLQQNYDELDGFICLDVPHAGIQGVFDTVEGIRKQHPNIILAVGNVVSGPIARDLVLAGADLIKIGVGSGALCSTRIKTGVGVPQLSAVIECAKFVHSVGGLVISDGGCQVPGDIAKAFGAGADMVMLGSMLGGHLENGTELFGMSSFRGNVELSGEMKDYRTSEGWEVEVPSRGPIENTIKDILGGLRSACSYVGAKSIQEFPTKTTFIQVNRQANMSLWEHRV